MVPSNKLEPNLSHLDGEADRLPHSYQRLAGFYIKSGQFNAALDAARKSLKIHLNCVGSDNAASQTSVKFHEVIMNLIRDDEQHQQSLQKTRLQDGNE